MMGRWEEVLWKEFNKLNPVDRFVTAGQWTGEITHELLTKLAEARRLAVLEGVNSGMDPVAFAEMAGAAPNAVKRLLEDARVIARRRTEEAA